MSQHDARQQRTVLAKLPLMEDHGGGADVENEGKDGDHHACEDLNKYSLDRRCGHHRGAFATALVRSVSGSAGIRTSIGCLNGRRLFDEDFQALTTMLNPSGARWRACAQPLSHQSMSDCDAENAFFFPRLGTSAGARRWSRRVIGVAEQPTHPSRAHYDVIHVNVEWSVLHNCCDRRYEYVTLTLTKKLMSVLVS